MLTPSRTARALVALVMAATIVGLSSAVPLLDAGGDPGPVVTTEDAGRGYVEHDHRICQLHGVTAWSLAAETTPPRESLVSDGPIPEDAALRVDLLLRSSNQPRAPPTT